MNQKSGENGPMKVLVVAASKHGAPKEIGTAIVQDPRRIGPALLSINPIDHQTFKGRMEFSGLSLRERSIARLGNAPEGDYREWDKIRAWAQQIAADLKEHLPEA